MLHVSATHQNWIDFLVINQNSPASSQKFTWTPEECKKIISASNNLELKPALILSDNAEEGNVDLSFRKTNRWLIPNIEPYGWIYERVCDTLLSANRDFWNLDVDLIETLELLQYKHDPTTNVNGHYNKHSDFGGDLTTRKVSYTALLSDPANFAGGDLIFYLQKDITMPKEQGQIILFPSLTFHEVTPVTQGDRWALVTWIRGRHLK